MITLKTYLVVVTVLLFLALGFGVYVWYMYQSVNAQSQTGTQVSPESSVATSSGQNVAATTSTSTPTVPQPEKPVTIDISKLPTAQQDILKRLGYSESITFSPAMITCAKNAVGETRFNAIVGGGAPSPLETVKLLPCFKA